MFLRCSDDILRIACAIPFPKTASVFMWLGEEQISEGSWEWGDCPWFTFLHDSLLRYNRRSVNVIPISDHLSQVSDWAFIATHPVFIRSRQFTCWLLLSQNWKSEIRSVTCTPTFPSENFQDHIRFRKWVSTLNRLNVYICYIYIKYLYYFHLIQILNGTFSVIPSSHTSADFHV